MPSVVQPSSRSSTGMAASSMASGDFRVGLGLLVGEQSPVIVRQGIEEVHLLRDVSELLAPGLEQAGNLRRVQRRVFHALADIGLCRPGKVLRRPWPAGTGR